MKVRNHPQSIYLKFQQPAAGREAIYIVGQNSGKLLAHDVGLNKLLAGTLRLDPTCERAMEDCRHPITEAGIGPLLHTLHNRWSRELDPSEAIVRFREGERVDPRPCSMIEVTHPQQRDDYMFFQVRVFIDSQVGLPIRFQGYDWPKPGQSDPDLVEEYTYANLKLNVGLGAHDFDVSNAAYDFGRF
jgi:hypothetical protein